MAFRFCPSGELKLGRPSPEKANQEDKESSDPLAALAGGKSVSLRNFYITETEVTITQFQRIVGDERFQSLKKRNETVNKGSPDLIQQLKTGGEYPIFMVSLDDAVDFCKKLDEVAAGGAAVGKRSIEQRRFRIPSHAEWQYACRASEDTMVAESLPHFNRWVDSFDALNKQDRARCLEEWEAMGRKKEDFTGSQIQVAEILTERLVFGNSKPLEILSAFLSLSLKLNRDYSKDTVLGNLAAVRSTEANAWQIFDMHENVCEWVLVIPDQGDSREFWNRLMTGAPSSYRQETEGPSVCRRSLPIRDGRKGRLAEIHDLGWQSI